MDPLPQALSSTFLFGDPDQSAIYLALLRQGPLGAEKLRQVTGIHRETIQRTLKKMEKLGTVSILKTGRNKKALASPVSELQKRIELQKDNFDLLLKPLLEAESEKLRPNIKIYTGSQAFGLLQTKLLKLQPSEHDIEVISARPKDWLEAMVQARRLSHFEELRLSKKVRFMLSCFSELRGQVEHNNREYFAGQPENLKRQYRYIDTDISSPLQIQIWFNTIVISIFESVPSIHIVIEDAKVCKAMRAYFKILWGVGQK